MASITDEFRQVVESVPVQPPAVPVVVNVTARPLGTADEVRHEMVAQLTSALRWSGSIEYMIAEGVQAFVELGPKEVLTGLVGRIDKSVTAAACGTVAGVQVLASS
jgi:[acyl-carrier-protein] S-malonyltransferase